MNPHRTKKKTPRMKEILPETKRVELAEGEVTFGEQARDVQLINRHLRERRNKLG